MLGQEKGSMNPPFPFVLSPFLQMA